MVQQIRLAVPKDDIYIHSTEMFIDLIGLWLFNSIEIQFKVLYWHIHFIIQMEYNVHANKVSTLPVVADHRQILVCFLAQISAACVESMLRYITT